ncbi:hypothetical protein DSS3PM1_00073 [Bacteriophage DSS3_PM1]|nr:hypothetical protein DSS3PM1_00073 [Bacteriophage DSS3_PM1]
MKKILAVVKSTVTTLKKKLHAVLMKIRAVKDRVLDRRAGVTVAVTQYTDAHKTLQVLVEERNARNKAESEELNWAMHHSKPRKPRKTKPLRRKLNKGKAQ